MDIEHDYIKEGRFYTKIHFTIKSKNKEDEKETIELQETQETPEEKLEKIGQGRLMDYPSETETTTKPRGLTDEQEIVYDRLINRGIWGKTAEEIAKTYDAKRIIDNIELARKQLPAEDKRLPGLIISYIKSDRVGTIRLQKKEAQEREAQRQKDRRQAYDDFHGTHLASIGKARADGAGEQEQKPSTNPNELSDTEVQFVVTFGYIPAYLKSKAERLKLTVEDIKAGKKK